MKKKMVRCYRGMALGADDKLEKVVFALPDFGDGKILHSCLACGARFVSDPESEHYLHINFNERVDSLACPGCGAKLRETLQPYPQAFRTSNGTVSSFSPPRNYPPDEQMTVIELWDLDS